MGRFRLVWDTSVDGLCKGNPHHFEEYVHEGEPRHVIVIQESCGFWYAFEIKGDHIRTVTAGKTKEEVREALIRMGYDLRR